MSRPETGAPARSNAACGRDLSDRSLSLVAATHYPPMPGGSSRSCALLWNAIARRGHRVSVLGPITPETHPLDGSAARGAPSTLSVERYDVPYFHLSPYSIEDFRRFQEIEHAAVRRRLPAAIDRARPDVVVSAHETLAEAVLEVARAKGLPCAVMLRGSPTWQIVTDQYPPAPTREYLDLYRRADLVIAVGEYMRDGLARRGVPNVVHIPNLLDRRAFSPGPRDPELAARYGISPDDVVVLHASVMQSRKRPQDVLRSVPIALRNAANLVYVFLGGEERAHSLVAMSREQGTAERTRFIDRVSYEEMPAHVRLADVVVLASEGEGMARVYLEAQACGRLLISSDIPAAREVIENGRTGLLFELGSAEGLAAQVLRAHADPRLRERIGRASRRRTAVHEIGRVVDRYVEAFAGLALRARAMPAAAGD